VSTGPLNLKLMILKDGTLYASHDGDELVHVELDWHGLRVETNVHPETSASLGIRISELMVEDEDRVTSIELADLRNRRPTL
jgi:hypothetical protein